METTKQPIGLSNQLEALNFKALLSDNSINLNRNRKHIKSTTRGNFREQILRKVQNRISPETIQEDSKIPLTCQFQLFQTAMKHLLISGQFMGLNPVSRISDHNPTKIRFTVFSWKFVYGVIIGIAQACATVLCFCKLLKDSVNIVALAYFAFYLSTGCNTFIFLRVASKWPTLIKHVYETQLDSYIDVKVKNKCFAAYIIFFSMSMTEHMLSLLSRFVITMDCLPKGSDLFESYIIRNFPWLFEFDVPYYLPVGIILQFLTLVSTINWSYSDLFIVCMSIYLTSILKQINKKIEMAGNSNHLPIPFWRTLREDYTRATRLVRSFDDTISSVIFLSFASNLFFICLQLYNILSNGVTSKYNLLKEMCPNYPSGPLGGYEQIMYLLFSLSFLLGRSLVVSLVAAKVHSASMVPASALYNIPRNMYCSEIQRFLDQVHGDKVALSGLRFFYVTRSLVLSVAGTIVTYELVLLQFSNED
ncbi:gustatory receptor for sugar taste 64e-like [Bombyx mandarina]|uniref:Gustatory receptor for sugar taste 64e-like n=1 Tax=Bombyx mandarina TaxID=7092 RepID=A0A6J2KBL2_BOMMA|nr:gustatory receptor for sugar taste 64e-like [Bombyx mandarina]